MSIAAATVAAIYCLRSVGALEVSHVGGFRPIVEYKRRRLRSFFGFTGRSTIALLRHLASPLKLCVYLEPNRKAMRPSRVL